MSLFFIISVAVLGFVGILALAVYMHTLILNLNLPDDDQDFMM